MTRKPKIQTANQTNTSKLQNLAQTNGKTLPEKPELPRTMDELFGVDGLSKYKTFNQDVYEKELREMTKSDLQNHAMKIGIAPLDDTPRLKKILLSEFVKHRSQYAKMPKPTSQAKEVTPEVRRIMAEGR